MPELNSYFQSGGLVDAVVNLGLPAPIDIQVSGSHQKEAYKIAQELAAARSRRLKGVSDVLIPQDLDYPALRLDIDREMASRLGLSSKEVVNNVITALTSNQMIAPSYWVDPKSGNDYMLTVQYPDSQIQSLSDLDSIPLRSPKGTETTQLGAVTNITRINSPTEVDHYQLQREIDLYVSPSTEDLGSVASQVDKIIAADQAARRGAHSCARLGGRHAAVVQELRPRPAALHRAGVPDPDGAVRLVRRSAHHSAGDSAGHHRACWCSCCSPARR